jgi:hypothetical protein
MNSFFSENPRNRADKPQLRAHAFNSLTDITDVRPDDMHLRYTLESFRFLALFKSPHHIPMPPPHPQILPAFRRSQSGSSTGASRNRIQKSIVSHSELQRYLSNRCHLLHRTRFLADIRQRTFLQTQVEDGFQEYSRCDTNRSCIDRPHPSCNKHRWILAGKFSGRTRCRNCTSRSLRSLRWSYNLSKLHQRQRRKVLRQGQQPVVQSL